MTCPDEECHAGKEKLEKCVDGLKRDIVKKSTVKWFAGICITIALFVGGYSLSAAAKEKEKRSENTAQIEVIKNDIEHIKRSVEKIEDNQMTPQQLLELMKRAVREAD